MSAYGRRAERWAIAVLEAVWAGRNPPRRWGLGAGDLQRLVRSNERVRAAFARLRELDDIVADAIDVELESRGGDEALVVETLYTVGPYALAVADAPDRFGERVARLWSADEDPLRRPAPGAWAALVALSVAAAVVMVVSPSTAPEFIARGTSSHDAPRVAAYCVVEGAAGLDTWSMSAERGCPLSGHLATSITDPRGRELGVVVFGIQRLDGRLSLVPYLPTPAAPAPAVLALGATEQRLGPVRRLDVNHAAGDLDVVALAFERSVGWDRAGAALAEAERTTSPRADADAVAKRVSEALEQGGATPAGRSVLRSRLSVE